MASKCLLLMLLFDSSRLDSTLERNHCRKRKDLFIRFLFFFFFQIFISFRFICVVVTLALTHCRNSRIYCHWRAFDFIRSNSPSLSLLASWWWCHHSSFLFVYLQAARCSVLSGPFVAINALISWDKCAVIEFHIRITVIKRILAWLRPPTKKKEQIKNSRWSCQRAKDGWMEKWDEKLKLWCFPESSDRLIELSLAPLRSALSPTDRPTD